MVKFKLLLFKIEAVGSGSTVMLNEVMELFLLGLSSVRMTLTS
jgi:hypothetical protein